MKSPRIYVILALLIIAALTLYCTYLCYKVEQGTVALNNLQEDLNHSQDKLKETADILQMCEDRYYKELGIKPDY
jgi:hypothetical protein